MNASNILDVFCKIMLLVISIMGILVFTIITIDTYEKQNVAGAIIVASILYPFFNVLLNLKKD